MYSTTRPLMLLLAATWQNLFSIAGVGTQFLSCGAQGQFAREQKLYVQCEIDGARVIVLSTLFTGCGNYYNARCYVNRGRHQGRFGRAV